MGNITTEVKFNDSRSLAELLGIFDENLEVIMRETNATVYVDENALKISGEKEDVSLAEKVITKLLDIIRAGEKLDKSRYSNFELPWNIQAMTSTFSTLKLAKFKEVKEVQYSNISTILVTFSVLNEAEKSMLVNCSIDENIKDILSTSFVLKDNKFKYFILE